MSARQRGAMADTPQQYPAPMDVDPPKPQKPSILQRIWKFLDLDPITVILMLKSALPPTIGLAIYQNKHVSEVYGNLGYLLPITCFIGFAALPRAKFIMNMLGLIIGVCITACFCTLGLWSATQARKHTTPTGEPLAGYNSSQSVVCGIWLFCLILLIASIRSAKPALQMPVIMCSVFTVVSFTTSGPNLGTPAQVRALMKLLLETQFTGFGIATAVHFLVVPINTRLPLFKQLAGFLGIIRGMLKAVASYLRTLENGLAKSSPQHLGALKGVTLKLKELHGKTTGDIGPAKMEVAFGKLNGTDIADLFNLMRKLIPGIMGLGSIARVVTNLPDIREVSDPDDSDDMSDVSSVTSHIGESQAGVKQTDTTDDLHNIAGAVAQAVIPALELMDEAIEHVLLTLQLSKPPKKSGAMGDDVEAKAHQTRPGDEGFASYFENKSSNLYEARRAVLKERYHARLRLSEIPELDEPIKEAGASKFRTTESSRVRLNRQNQLVFVLYLEWFVDSVTGALLELVHFADGKVQDGTMQRNRFIYPGQERLLRFFARHGHGDHDPNSGGVQPDTSLQKSPIVERLNPERLPPATKLQFIGDKIAYLPHLLRSPHAAFGFRTACAVLTIAIVSFLKDSHVFAAHQRFLWAEMTIAIGMVRTAGLGLFHLVLRTGGTALAMAGCYAVWYMVDGHPAGVIVFAYIWYAMLFWIIFKKPQFMISGFLAVVATTLILGYELQVHRIGIEASLASGQDYYPTYELAPYRVVAVIAGLLVAFFWTIFPYPISEHSEIRRDISEALFLLSNHYAITREIVQVGLANESSSAVPKKKVHDALESARFEFWTGEAQLLGRTRTNLAMQPWQVYFGSKFPSEKYEALVNHTETIMNYSSLLASASRSLALDNADEDLKLLIESAPMTSHLFASRVCLLSNCLGNGNALPPGLEPLTGNAEAECVEKQHSLTEDTVGKPGYAAVVVLQVASRVILTEIDELTELVKSLVGELRFEYKLD